MILPALLELVFIVVVFVAHLEVSEDSSSRVRYWCFGSGTQSWLEGTACRLLTTWLVQGAKGLLFLVLSLTPGNPREVLKFSAG